MSVNCHCFKLYKYNRCVEKSTHLFAIPFLPPIPNSNSARACSPLGTPLEWQPKLLMKVNGY